MLNRLSLANFLAKRAGGEIKVLAKAGGPSDKAEKQVSLKSLVSFFNNYKKARRTRELLRGREGYLPNKLGVHVKSLDKDVAVNEFVVIVKQDRGAFHGGETNWEDWAARGLSVANSNVFGVGSTLEYAHLEVRLGANFGESASQAEPKGIRRGSVYGVPIPVIHIHFRPQVLHLQDRAKGTAPQTLHPVGKRRKSHTYRRKGVHLMPKINPQ